MPSDPRAPRGWRVSLDFHGRRLLERAFRGDAPVTVGEGPLADLILPGIGPETGAERLVEGDRLYLPDGLEGELHRGGTRQSIAALRQAGAPVHLHVGDWARLHLTAHPAVELRISHEPQAPLHLGLRHGLRDLAHHLLLGAALVGAVALLTRLERPIADTELKGDPSAVDSPLARVLFASLAELPAPPAHPRIAPPPSLSPAPARSPAPDAPIEPGPDRPRLLEPLDKALTIDPSPAHEPSPPTRTRPPRPPADGVDAGPSASHAASGARQRRGAHNGAAALASTITCDDPQQRPKEQVDVVFVIDVSTTMGFMLDRIDEGVLEVDAAVRQLSVDPRYGLVVFVDDVLVANAGEPYTSVQELRRELRRWRSFTASNRQIHSPEANLDWPENSLDALHAAATAYNWRPAADTLRLVVHATDDDFGESPAIQSGQRVQHSYHETVRALRGAEIRVATFAAALGGQCECLDVKPGLRAPFGEQPSIPDATGGAAFDIDDLAAGAISLTAAVKAAVNGAICRSYPLLPAL